MAQVVRALRRHGYQYRARNGQKNDCDHEKEDEHGSAGLQRPQTMTPVPPDRWRQ
jgi:hypothetical protein